MGFVSRSEARIKRKKRVRKKVRGTSEMPRLMIFRSSKNIYAQIIDDSSSSTVLSFSSVTKFYKDQKKKGTNKDAAFFVGERIAQLAKEKGITKICFDRAGYKYHGRVKALADGARAGGLQF